MVISRRVLLHNLSHLAASSVIAAVAAACGSAVSTTLPATDTAPVSATSPTALPGETPSVPTATVEVKEIMEKVRVPSGQRVVKNLPVLDLGIRPEVPLDKWTLEISGEIENRVTLNWQDFQTLPHVERLWDFHCVTGWTKLDTTWGGVLLSEIIKLAKPKSSVVAVIFDCRDNYSTNIVYKELLANEGLLVDKMNGEALPLQHGGPVRGMIPYLYAWKSAKFVSRVRFLDHDEPGYWEVRGYHNHADPWKAERFG